MDLKYIVVIILSLLFYLLEVLYSKPFGLIGIAIAIGAIVFLKIGLFKNRKRTKDLDLTIKQLEKGNYKARVFIEEEKNLSRLAKSINKLARRLEEIEEEKDDIRYWNENLGDELLDKKKLISTIERQQIELKEKNKELERITRVDGLTELYNHKYTYERLDEEMKEVDRYKKDLAIIMFDIDHFKDVNDTYGHRIGDRVLVAVSNSLRESCREVDILGRYGGEEFITILPETNLKGAFILAERIREEIEALRFEGIEDLKITISGGVCQITEEEDPLLFVERADKLLYKAKESGRNKIMIK